MIWKDDALEMNERTCFFAKVTSFFAPSSRYGTPEDLRQLIDEAHRLKVQGVKKFFFDGITR